MTVGFEIEIKSHSDGVCIEGITRVDSSLSEAVSLRDEHLGGRRPRRLDLKTAQLLCLCWLGRLSPVPPFLFACCSSVRLDSFIFPSEFFLPNKSCMKVSYHIHGGCWEGMHRGFLLYI